MPDDMSPLAAALQSEDRTYLGTYKSAAYWNNLAFAASRHLRAAPPAAPAERPTCATCPYWAGDGDSDDSKLAECRRRNPTETFEGHIGWVLVSPYIWCGDHPDMPAWIAARAEGGR